MRASKQQLQFYPPLFLYLVHITFMLYLHSFFSIYLIRIASTVRVGFALCCVVLCHESCLLPTPSALSDGTTQAFLTKSKVNANLFIQIELELYLLRGTVRTSQNLTWLLTGGCVGCGPNSPIRIRVHFEELTIGSGWTGSFHSSPVT